MENIMAWVYAMVVCWLGFSSSYKSSTGFCFAKKRCNGKIRGRQRPMNPLDPRASSRKPTHNIPLYIYIHISA